LEDPKSKGFVFADDVPHILTDVGQTHHNRSLVAVIAFRKSEKYWVILKFGLDTPPQNSSRIIRNISDSCSQTKDPVPARIAGIPKSLLES
jgi:hypothetical protein